MKIIVLPEDSVLNAMYHLFPEQESVKHYAKVGIRLICWTFILDYLMMRINWTKSSIFRTPDLVLQKVSKQRCRISML